MVFEHSGGRDFEIDLPRESLSLEGVPTPKGVIPMVFEHSVIGNGNIKCNDQMGLYMSSD